MLGNPLVTLPDLSPLQPKDNGNAGAGGPGRLSALNLPTLPAQPAWLQVQLSASTQDQSLRSSKTRGTPPTAQTQRVSVGSHSIFSSRGKIRLHCHLLGVTSNSIWWQMTLNFSGFCLHLSSTGAIGLWHRVQFMMGIEPTALRM